MTRGPGDGQLTEIMRLLDHLPPTFPFRGAILGAVPRPVKKVGPLELDPVSPMSFGFQWGVKPVFDLKSSARPSSSPSGERQRPLRAQADRQAWVAGATTGLFGQGDFKGTIDWTSQAAQSRPQIDLQGSFLGGIVGRF